MRYFQRAIRRAALPVAYSEGFSPHQILSFASPLGVGLESTGEYFDLRLVDDAAAGLTSDEAADRLNREMAEGIRILSFRKIPDDAKNCMSIVHAADYRIRFEAEDADGSSFPEIWKTFSGEELSALRDAVSGLLSMKQIPAMKKGKNKVLREVDIRPMIFTVNADAEGLTLRIAQGSEANLKPSLLLQALTSTEKGEAFSGMRTRIIRTELYDSSMRTLESYGTKF